MAFLQLISAILFQVSAVTEYAYSAELTNCPQQQSKYQSYFFRILLLSMMFYMVQVLVPGKLFNAWEEDDDVTTARWGALLASLWTIPLFAVTWIHLFPEERQPLSSRIMQVAVMPATDTSNQTSSSSRLCCCWCWTVGFRKLHQTFSTIIIHRQFPAVFWFLLSAMCCGSANWSINTVAITYFSEFLLLPSPKIGLVILTILLGGIPGTWIGKYTVGRYCNPVVSCKLCLLLFIVVITAASSGLSPSTTNSNFVFLFGFMLGVCKGWFHPIETALYVTIIPKDNNNNNSSVVAEMMGVYVFANHIFAFLPPLFFTLLNETQGLLSMRWGLASINIFFAFGLLFLHQIKDYDEAVRQAGEERFLLPNDDDDDRTVNTTTKDVVGLNNDTID